MIMVMLAVLVITLLLWFQEEEEQDKEQQETTKHVDQKNQDVLVENEKSLKFIITTAGLLYLMMNTRLLHKWVGLGLR